MFKKILFATDGSECSKRAEKYAIELAKDEKGEITAINVGDISYAAVPIGIDGTTMPILDISNVIENEKKNAEKILYNFKQTAEKKGVRGVYTIVKIGKPGPEIIEESNKYDYNIIVVGSKGLTGLERLLLGSVAEYVIRHSEIPVIVVKDKKKKNNEINEDEKNNNPIIVDTNDRGIHKLPESDKYRNY